MLEWNSVPDDGHHGGQPFVGARAWLRVTWWREIAASYKGGGPTVKGMVTRITADTEVELIVGEITLDGPSWVG